MERVNELDGWSQLELVGTLDTASQLLSDSAAAAEARVGSGSLLAGLTLRETQLRNKHRVSVVAWRRDSTPVATDIRDERLQPGDVLLLHGARDCLSALGKSELFAEFQWLDETTLTEWLGGRLMTLRVPVKSVLTGKTIKEARLGEALGMGVLLIERPDGKRVAPVAETTIREGDTVVAKGAMDDLLLVQGLSRLEIRREMGQLESERVGMAEAVLSPRTTLDGKTLRQLQFREKYGLSVLAVWRGGRPYRTKLADMPLRLGDALLVYGRRERLSVLGREPDFIVLTGAAQEPPRLEKSKLAVLIMAAVLLPVILGLAPTYIMAVMGAAVMVLTGCLTTPEAYRAIEWRAVFLIAGLLPLGHALEETGTAHYLAERVIAAAGPHGPLPVMAGLLMLTFLAKCVVPGAALVVLMAPVVMSAAGNLDVSPHTMMMGLALASSSSFLSPISHPANLLVMGPGGYRFGDYIKVGLPLTLVVGLTILLATPWLRPFR